MTLIPVTDAARWDAFVSSLPQAQFTQSWAWGVFRQSRGQEVVRLAMEGADGAFVAAALFFRFSAPVVGGYWYAPRGPVTHTPEAATRFLDVLAREKPLPGRALFWRVEPTAVRVPMPDGFVRRHAYMPTTTLLVDLTQSEDVLQKAMHEKTRYNIRVAERRGVTVRTATDARAIETFLRLNAETASRDGFVSQPAAYIRATVEALAPAGMARLRIAEKTGVPLAASVEVLFGDTVTYLYGASSSAERNVMAPYALHWSALMDAKRGGYRFYDFHGLNPADTSSFSYTPSWEGITRFKLGWGGARVEYAGTWELPQMSFLYTVFRRMRAA